MTNNEWVKVVEDHEGAVRDGIEAVIRIASEDDNCTIAATMDSEGHVSEPFIDSGIDGDVYAGDAIYICRRQASTDFEYTFGDLLYDLTEKQLTAFLVWCQGNDEIPDIDTMSEWDHEIFDTAVASNIEDYVDATIDSEVEAEWVQLIEKEEEA